MDQRPRVVKDTVYTCVVLHNMLRTHQGGTDRAPTPGNDEEVLHNEQVVCVPNETCKNHSREAKHQRKLLKTTLIMWGHWLGRRTGSERCQLTTLVVEVGIYQSFSGLLSVRLKTTQLSKEHLV